MYTCIYIYISELYLLSLLMATTAGTTQPKGPGLRLAEAGSPRPLAWRPRPSRCGPTPRKTPGMVGMSPSRWVPSGGICGFLMT